MRVSEQRVLEAVAELEPVSVGELAFHLGTDKALVAQLLVRGLGPAGKVLLRKGPDSILRASMTQTGYAELTGAPV